MILVDTSVWVDHFRLSIALLSELLVLRKIVIDPFGIGERAPGNIRRNARLICDLRRLPRANVASAAEVLILIEKQGLPGSGIGYVEAHLLVSAMLTPESALWTRDTRLARVAGTMRLPAIFHWLRRDFTAENKFPILPKMF